METAKVDIRKLQLLNDRIAQCFDALNQVRLSVHGVQGLSHTSAIDPRIAGLGGVQQNPVFGIGQQVSPYQQQAFSPYQQQPMSPYQTGQSPYGVGQQPIPGLGHTTAFPGASPTQGWDPRLAANPMLNPQGIGGMNPQVNPLVNPLGLGIGNPLTGLSHTGAEAIDPSALYGRPAWADPVLAARIVQTFPYATFAFLPVTSSI